MANSIFRNNTRSIPESDAQIVRVDMDQLDIGGRKSSLPAAAKSSDMTVRHVSSNGRE
jgi:hypothetical protein